MLERVNLQHIREFIHNGTSARINEVSYFERLNLGEAKILELLKTAFHEKEKFEQAENELRLAFSVYENVYMEIGMKVGARLVTCYGIIQRRFIRRTIGMRITDHEEYVDDVFCRSVYKCCAACI